MTEMDVEEITTPEITFIPSVEAEDVVEDVEATQEVTTQPMPKIITESTDSTDSTEPTVEPMFTTPTEEEQ